MQKQKVYFPNLNGLRFIAALLVIIHHIEQFKSIIKLDNYLYKIPFVLIIGKIGVVLFFVLSGFLITYLLLAEENSFKTISVKKFYIRRILRIWPLYFLIIILAFLVLPHISIFTLPGFGKDVIYAELFLKLFLYVIFFPNLVLSLLGMVPYVSHTWSIGTEEQYYLVWPVILKYFKKHRLLLMLIIIAAYLAVSQILSAHYPASLPYKKVFVAFWAGFNIDCMAIGGIYAILLFQKNRLLKILLNNYLVYATIILVIVLLVTGFIFPFLHYELYSVLFGIVILNFAANDKMKISLENRLFNYLGNISYGLYMYHPVGIVLALRIGLAINLSTNWFFYPLSLIITICLAGLSYKYYESFFLKFKNTFARVISGNEVKGRLR